MLWCGCGVVEFRLSPGVVPRLSLIFSTCFSGDSSQTDPPSLCPFLRDSTNSMLAMGPNNCHVHYILTMFVLHRPSLCSHSPLGHSRPLARPLATTRDLLFKHSQLGRTESGARRRMQHKTRPTTRQRGGAAKHSRQRLWIRARKMRQRRQRQRAACAPQMDRSRRGGWMGGRGRSGGALGHFREGGGGEGTSRRRTRSRR